MAGPVKSEGFALFWVLLILLFWSAPLSRLPLGNPHADPTGEALAAAKAALLGYAAAYPEIRRKDTGNRLAYVPGHLPCPTRDNTGNLGQEAPECSKQGVSALGRLPWTSLGLSPLLDDSGECLWYAVSGHYKANPKADLLNPDIPGQFSVHALTANGTVEIAADVVAVIIAPGKPLAGQKRALSEKSPCASELSAENFLDAHPAGSNATISTAPESTHHFFQASAPSSGDSPPNDRMSWITRKELWDVLRKRPVLKRESALFDTTYPGISPESAPALAQRVAECLREFARAGNGPDPGQFGRLPWAASLKLSAAAPDTFKNDHFNDQKNLLAGRLPLFLRDSKLALGNRMFPGTLALCSTRTDTDCRLFRTNNCPTLLPVAGFPTAYESSTNKDAPDGWLEKWKDHLFYAVAPAYQPAAGYAASCQGNRCLLVNGRPYAAIVVYAGAALPGQNRLQARDKQVITNYLEGENASSIANNDRFFSTAGNDRMVCLRPDLTLSNGCLD